MVAIIHGSSYFKPFGQTAIAGPTGSTGFTGPTGPSAEGRIGNTGYSGAGITWMYLVDDDKLYTEFNAQEGPTGSYTTLTRIKGPTGDTYNLIDVLNASSTLGGETIGKGRNDNFDPNTIIIRSLEVTGDYDGSAISLVQNEFLNNIDINYDRGNFGYLDVQSGTANQLVAIDDNITNPLWISGITGATYDTASSFDLEEGVGKNYNALNAKVKSYKEKIKYLIVSSSGDIQNVGGDGEDPMYITPIDSPINPNEAKNIIIDMRQLADVDDTDGNTGPLQLRFRDASFGYTGNVLNSDDDLRDLSKAFTMEVIGASSGYEQVRFDGGNIIWPLDKEPCWSGGDDIINFFWLPCESRDIDGDGIEEICPKGAAWHGNMVQYHSQGNTGDPFHCISDKVTYKSTNRNYPFISGMTGTTGACCVGDGTCVYTTSDLCYGYYFGAGTTCGGSVIANTGSVCYEANGACCVTNTQTNISTCYDNSSANECIELGNPLNKISSFGGTGSQCVDMKCDDISKEFGACCDGIGNCSQISESQCKKKGHYFLGVGVSCYSGTHKFEVCSGGTGACCQGTEICVDGLSGGGCIESGYLYAGHRSLCNDINCRNNTTTSSCVQEVTKLNLNPGDLYAGGMVVGLYQPYSSSVVGVKAFGGNKTTPWQTLMEGATGSTSDARGLECESYKSKYDFHGYGFDSKGCGEYGPMSIHQEDISRPDAYYMIVSMDPLGITGDREIINPTKNPGATSEFYWGNHGSAWGPIYNQIIGRYDDFMKLDYFKLKEGYWYNSEMGDISYGNIAPNTFTSCKEARRLGNGAVEKLQTKPIQTAHGQWHRNWGLYNNIRIISADNALSQNYNNNDGFYSSTDFGPGLSADYVSAFRATRLYDDRIISIDGITGSSPNNVSSWHMPSHDEMAYIASNVCREHDGFDLNAKLLEEDGTPLNDWYWTSTGAFNETKGITHGTGEGIAEITSGVASADPGTLAWAMKFDVNGIKENFIAGKKDRTHNTYQVRPIRFVRCDGRFAESSDINYKLWKLPNVLRDEDKGINQEF